uniref:Amino acid transporter transmembrane domain-containing protein n=1 Tax=Meloidogyne javanica TaxID=6303 RepID=A0A915M601_MELJA
MNYGEVMEAALMESGFEWSKKWAKPAKFFVNGTIILLLMGIGCIKYDFIVVHLRELFGQFTNFHASALAWALIIFPPMVLVNFTRTLQRIAILNTVGNVFMFGAYGIIFYHLLQSPHKTSQLPWIGSPSGVFTACGSILYCFEGQALVLPMENKMKHPSEMLGPFGVLSTGMALTEIFDSAVGFLGYSKFGDEIQGSVTLNLPPTSLLTFVKIPLVGFSGGVFLAFIFPPIIDTFTFLSIGLTEYYEENNKRNLISIFKRFALNFFFVSIGLFGSIVGLKSSLEAIFELNGN